MGFVIKVHAVYETPFWRDLGYSGHRVQPVRARARGVRQQLPRRPARHPRRLRLGRGRRRRLPAHARGAQGAHPGVAVRTTTATQALNPVVYYESDWGSEEWTRGAYAASFDMGGLARYGADLRTPVGPDPLLLQRHGGQGLPARRRRDPRRPRDGGGDRRRGGARLTSAAGLRRRFGRSASESPAALLRVGDFGPLLLHFTGRIGGWSLATAPAVGTAARAPGRSATRGCTATRAPCGRMRGLTRSAAPAPASPARPRPLSPTASPAAGRLRGVPALHPTG